jgi:hypothetical protein
MTMTRETKIGVVVCLSFLCLVGVVLGTKLRGDPAEEDELALKEEIIAEPQPAAPAENLPPMRIPAHPGGDTTSPFVIQTGAVQDAQPLPPPPAQVSQIGNGGYGGQATHGPGLDVPPPGTKESQSSVSTPATGIPAQGEVVFDTWDSPAGPRPLVTPANVRALSLWGAIPVPLASDTLSAASATLGQSGPSDVPPPPADSAASAGDRSKTATVVNERSSVSSPAGAIVEGLTLGADAGQPGGVRGQLPQAQVRGANPGEETRGGQPSGGTLQPKPDDITLSMNPPPPAAGAVLLPPQPPLGGALRADGGATAGADSDRTRVSPSASDARPAQPVVQVSATDTPRRVGETPTATTPPIVVPAPGASARPAAPTIAQVESYDEETYRIKSGDTFDRISAAHFNTDKYAKALERWNASHPQASDNLRANPLVLESGQLVYIPPAYMLEKRYGSLVPGYKPQAQPAAASDPQRTANASPRGEAAGNAAPSFKWYLVSPPGQMIRDIARITVSDAERWADISKLNPALETAYPLRTGLLIKVPADARIPAANLPQSASR